MLHGPSAYHKELAVAQVFKIAFNDAIAFLEVALSGNFLDRYPAKEGYGFGES